VNTIRVAYSIDDMSNIQLYSCQADADREKIIAMIIYKDQRGVFTTKEALVRIENPEVNDCSPAPFKVNYLYLYFSQKTTILDTVRFCDAIHL
jgi:hypothetical protein